MKSHKNNPNYNNNNNKKIPAGAALDFWEITPHQNYQYDACYILVSDDPSGRKALDYAKDTLEFLWDTCECMEDLDIKVTLKRVVADPEDIDFED